MKEEEYIQLLYEIEREIDDDECEDRWEEAIRRANEKCKRAEHQRFTRTKCQKYSPLPRLKPRTRRRKRVH